MTPGEMADRLLDHNVGCINIRDAAAAMLREAERLLGALTDVQPPAQGIAAWREEAIAWLEGGTAGPPQETDGTFYESGEEFLADLERRSKP